MQARLTTAGLWLLHDDALIPAGLIRITGDGVWELSQQSDPDFFDAASPLRLGALFAQPLAAANPFKIPLAAAMEFLQLDDNQMRVVEQLLPWFPLLLAGQYAQQTEWRARLALLFARLAAHFDNAGLLATEALLEQQAYEALAELYEHEPARPTQGRYRVLEQAFKQAFRAWQPRITNPGDSWLFAHLVLKVNAEQPDHVAVSVAAKAVNDAEIARRREAALLTLVTRPVKVDYTQRMQLRRFFRETQQGQEAVRTLIERWFLPRYDLQGAEQLKAALASLETEDKHGYLPAHRIGWACWLHWSERFVLSIMVVYLLLTPVLWPYLQQGAGATVVQILMYTLYCVGGLPPLLFWFCSTRPDLSLPRLMAGIVVAVIGTILQQRWDAVLRFVYLDGQPTGRFLIMLAICLVFLLAAGRVMVQKVSQATGYGAEARRRQGWQTLFANVAVQPVVRQRTLAVMRRGLQIAFLFSLLLVDMLGSTYLTDVSKGAGATLPGCPLQSIPGVFGATYPILVFFLTTLILFAGVFTQFIGDDKALTEAVA
ncbi:MAG: hypothetical protein DYG89_41415 [Caldilinea sp. CFX5]|nr:hypothetical protein [Caldilinea sp. CFX5]